MRITVIFAAAISLKIAEASVFAKTVSELSDEFQSRYIPWLTSALLSSTQVILSGRVNASGSHLIYPFEAVY